MHFLKRLVIEYLRHLELNLQPEHMPGLICWKYALEAIIKGLLLYFLVHDNCLLFML